MADVPPPHAPTRVLVTGGAGFIGSAFVRRLLGDDPRIALVVTLDALTYAGNRLTLADVDAAHGDRHRLVVGDVADERLLERLFAEHRPDTVVHFAAESHVDRSIDGPAAFLRTNVVGTFALLQAARRAWGERRDVRFHHVSTDEVYGSLGADGRFTEETHYDPSSPYSATKAAADHLARAWHRTFGLPVTISNCSNNYGAYQYPEKLIPLMIRKAVAWQPLPVYGDGGQVRDWLHVADHCSAIDAIVRRGSPGRTYNVGGDCERRNLDVVQGICDAVDAFRPESGRSRRSLISFVPDRPGHDRRYAIDASRIERELGWRPAAVFDRALVDTVRWYVEHDDWCAAVLAGRYAGERLGVARDG